MTTKATKVELLLDLAHIEPERSEAVLFVYPNEDTPDEIKKSLWLDWDNWEDLGCPSVVTITVRAGDYLNEGEED